MIGNYYFYLNSDIKLYVAMLHYVGNVHSSVKEVNHMVISIIV
ncbi:hypothetical protein CTK_C03780 [Clostridium tyrobutyricum]|nr:hypothetical protein CTK_C03780 [Clostridium tyrobutyricum]